MFPIDRYKFYVAGNKVIAVTTYAKKKVRATATCSPNDEFSLEDGKKLAAARCAQKVAQKRYKRALAKEDEAYEQYMFAELYLDKMACYRYDAEKELLDADMLVEETLKNLE